MRVCVRCKKNKRISEYYLNKRRVPGDKESRHNKRCKACTDKQNAVRKPYVKKDLSDVKIDKKWLVRGNISNSNRTSMMEH